MIKIFSPDCGSPPPLPPVSHLYGVCGAGNNERKKLLGWCTRGCCLHEGKICLFFKCVTWIAWIVFITETEKCDGHIAKLMKMISLSAMLLIEVQTCRKPAPKEDVKELLRRDVSLKVSVKGAVVSVRVMWLGWSMTGCLCRALVPTLIILLPFLWVTEHCICIAYSWIEKKSRETQILKFNMNNIYIILNISLWKVRSLLLFD